VLEKSYVRASQGVLILRRASDLHGPRAQGQDRTAASSRTRLSLVQKRWKLRFRMNRRSGSARRVAPVGCPYTRNRKRVPCSVGSTVMRPPTGGPSILRSPSTRSGSYSATSTSSSIFFPPGARWISQIRPHGQRTVRLGHCGDRVRLPGGESGRVGDVREHLGRSAIDLGLNRELEHAGIALVACGPTACHRCLAPARADSSVFCTLPAKSSERAAAPALTTSMN